VVWRMTKLEMIFYNSGGWESGGPRRVTTDGSVDSVLQFWPERGGDEIKHCRKMKRRY
jgi:hypothetical protein